MSRSRRKTPVFGNTSATSERVGKKLWHGRFRAKERTALSSTKDLSTHMPTTVLDASNVWSMEKDGRWYGRPERLEAISLRAASRGKTKLEKESLRIRAIKKWRRK